MASQRAGIVEADPSFPHNAEYDEVQQISILIPLLLDLLLQLLFALNSTHVASDDWNDFDFVILLSPKQNWFEPKKQIEQISNLCLDSGHIKLAKLWRGRMKDSTLFRIDNANFAQLAQFAHQL